MVRVGLLSCLVNVMQKAWWLKWGGLLDCILFVVGFAAKDLQSCRKRLCVLRSSSITIVFTIIFFLNLYVKEIMVIKMNGSPPDPRYGSFSARIFIQLW